MTQCLPCSLDVRKVLAQAMLAFVEVWIGRQLCMVKHEMMALQECVSLGKRVLSACLKLVLLSQIAPYSFYKESLTIRDLCPFHFCRLYSRYENTNISSHTCPRNCSYQPG
jgi:hypothetical protein